MDNLMYFGEGTTPIHILPNGGFGRHGHPDSIDCPVLSWEREYYLYRMDRQRRMKIYLLAWLSFYPPGKEGGKGGSLLHVGWQYPHCMRFDGEQLSRTTFEHYYEVAQIVYTDCEYPVDREVTKFINAEHLK